MKETVYFIEASDDERDEILCDRLRALIEAEDLLGFIADRDITAVKTHFGESPELGYPRPPLIWLKNVQVSCSLSWPMISPTVSSWTTQKN